MAHKRAEVPELEMMLQYSLRRQYGNKCRNESHRKSRKAIGKRRDLRRGKTAYVKGFGPYKMSIIIRIRLMRWKAIVK